MRLILPAFRLVIFSNKSPEAIVRLLERLGPELVDARVCAVLYEKSHTVLASQKFFDVIRKLPGFLNYARHEASRRIRSVMSFSFDAAVRFFHACPRKPNGPVDFSLSDLDLYLRRHDCELLVIPDAAPPEALAFVTRQNADLGVVFGAGCKASSFLTIPRLGSIRLSSFNHRDADSDSLRARVEEPNGITIAVDRVAEQPDEELVLREVIIPIGRYDDLQSLALKAEAVGNDLLVAAVTDCMGGRPYSVARSAKGRFRTELPMLLHGQEPNFARPRYSAKRTRPVWKLLARTIVLLPFAVVRNRYYRWRKAFPIVIFYHHVITDRPHHLGTPTAVFARQIAFLRKFYRIASLEQAMQMLEEGKVPVPTVVLTFDDGYADNFVNLRAVAQRYNIPVFLFLSTAHIGSNTPFGHDVRRQQTGFAPLSWDQVTVLNRAGFSFGCHTRSHFDCGSTDTILLEDEIAGSKRELGSRAGILANCFSFPWGMPENMSDEAQGLAKASFQYVFAAAGGVNVIGEDPQGSLLRRENHPNSLWEVELSAQCLLNIRSWRDLFPGLFGAATPREPGRRAGLAHPSKKR